MTTCPIPCLIERERQRTINGIQRWQPIPGNTRRSLRNTKGLKMEGGKDSSSLLLLMISTAFMDFYDETIPLTTLGLSPGKSEGRSRYGAIGLFFVFFCGLGVGNYSVPIFGNRY